MTDQTDTDALEARCTRAEQPRPTEAWQTCRIGSCQRHQECMYFPCRNGAGAVQIGTRCKLCGTAAPEAFAAECDRPECEYRMRPTEATSKADAGLAGEFKTLVADWFRSTEACDKRLAYFAANNHAIVLAALSNVAAAENEAAGLHIVFDGPPGPEAGRFVEVETPDGRSVNAGEWHQRPDGYWELRIARMGEA